MGNGPTIPDPNLAAIQGIEQQASNYPFEYLINALSQTGGSANVNGQNYDFTGLGNADVQNQLSQQMAQTLLQIQQGLGPEYVQQALTDLQQSDPTGYAARQQLFDQILAETNQAAPNLQLSQDTQNAIMAELQKGSTLDPLEQQQVQQGVRANQVSSGVYLGNAPQAAEASAVVGAGDQMQSQRQAAASQFLQSGVDPTDIQYRQIQQDMANLGAFINGQSPTAEFSSISGAQSGAAPYNNTGYQAPGINEGQGAQQGVQNALGIYSGEVNWADNQVNPYLAGLNMGGNIADTAFNLGYNPWNMSSPSGTVTGSGGYSTSDWASANGLNFGGMYEGVTKPG